MFGYVRVNSAELKVREYEAYRAVYCGLCGSMGKCTGQCSRVTLSYDFAFLAAFRICLDDTEIKYKKKRCFVHPLRKRSVMERNPQLDYCARSAAVLAYHKVKDDIDDEKRLKKLSALFALPFVSVARKKALKAGLGELDAKVSALLVKLADIEKRGIESVDVPADIFGELLGEMTSHGFEGSKRRIAYNIGHSVGKWIYMADALDDLEEDEKKGRYNPFLLLYGGRAPDERELAAVLDALRVGLCSAEAAIDLMETQRGELRAVVENILFLGMPQLADNIINKRKEDKNDG